MSTKDDKVMRSFDTGATRDTADGKLDYDGFLSPAVLKQFARFMNMNRLQSDGQLRDSDNWQKGIPMDVYMKSGYRHFMDWWTSHRYGDTPIIDRKPCMAALCGLLFNVMGYMHEELKRHPEVSFDGDEPTPEMKDRQDSLKGMDDPDMKYPQEDEKTFCGNDEVAENCEGCNVGTSECKFSGKGFTPEMKGPSLIEAKELVEQILFPEEDYTWSTTIGVTDPPEPVKTVDLTGYCEGEFGDFCEAMCGWVDQCKDMIIGKNGTESIPALPDDEPEKEFNKAGCNGCINRLKSFSIYPCVVCVRNSVGTSDGHDYYHDGDW